MSLVTAHSSGCGQMCRRICPEASDDAVSEAVCRISDRLLESKILYRLMNYLDKEHKGKVER